MPHSVERHVTKVTGIAFHQEVLND